MTSSVKVNVENVIVLCTYAYTYVWTNFKAFDPAISQVILITKNWLEIRKINK